MKKHPVRTLVAILAVLILPSCTKTLYSHEQVMNNFKTKSSVIEQFGLPTEKRVEGNIEEWIYNFGSTSSTSTTIRPGTKGRYYGDSYTYQYDKYVKFVFVNDNVRNWSSEGVNYRVGGKVDMQKTLWITVGSVALLVGIVSALSY